MVDLTEYIMMINETNSQRDLYLIVEMVCKERESDKLAVADHEYIMASVKSRMAELVTRG